MVIMPASSAAPSFGGIVARSLPPWPGRGICIVPIGELPPPVCSSGFGMSPGRDGRGATSVASIAPGRAGGPSVASPTCTRNVERPTLIAAPATSCARWPASSFAPSTVVRLVWPMPSMKSAGPSSTRRNCSRPTSSSSTTTSARRERPTSIGPAIGSTLGALPSSLTCKRKRGMWRREMLDGRRCGSDGAPRQTARIDGPTKSFPPIVRAAPIPRHSLDRSR